ncbi:zinc ribbon domain-containing protein [Gammaproteobacteria bacterium]|nr:zinc ribbon domain-containing protein [Gammaproteobacteria bacterium]
MPIYEYKCSKCGHFMDALQGVNDSPLEVCPECSEKSLKKLISAPNFRLSGEGWYETDFKTGSKKNIAENGKSKTKKKESNEQSSDSKSDKKKEKKKDNSSKTD